MKLPPIPLLVAAASLAVVGCHRAEPAPVFRALLCPEGAAFDSACSEALRSREFDHWAGQALRQAQSVFEVWTFGPSGARLARRVCIPESWGANVMAAKAEFLLESRLRLLLPVDGAGAESCIGKDGKRGAALVAGAAPFQLAEDSSARPVHVAVVCDRSNSTTGSPCDLAALEAYYREWVPGGTTPGSTFTVYGVSTSRDGTGVLFTTESTRTSLGERTAALLSSEGGLGKSLEKAPAGSAIAEALHVALGDLQRHRGVLRLLVHSDLRQVTPGRWNFERTVPSPAVFLRWLEKQRLVGDLRGVELRLAGMHHRRAPGAAPFDAKLAEQVAVVWREAFALMNVRAPVLQTAMSGSARTGNSEVSIADRSSY